MTQPVRTEHDLLGDRVVPADAYYGIHTLRALENFCITGTPISHYPDLIVALACVKQAAAIANAELGLLDDKGFAAALQKKPEFALMMLGTMIMRLRGMIARLSGIPSTAEMKDSRVFDKNLLNQMIQGLGDQAVVRYEKGKIIMIAGQAGALMYVVTEGRVAISIRGAVVDRVGPGGIFGEMALIDQSPRAANAVAEADCALLAINRNVFLNLVKSEPRFGIFSSVFTASTMRWQRSMA